jgi:hypothetical protein
MAAVAVRDFEIEPSRYTVWAVAGTEFSRSAMPKPADHTTSPSWTMAADNPGTLLVAINVVMAVSTCARLSSDSVSD